MDTSEAMKIVMSRIQSLDPENASRIIGHILIQEQGEKELIRLAFCPENLLSSYIKQALASLGFPSNTSSSNPSTPLSYPIRPNNPFPQNSPRIMIPNNGFHLSNPSSLQRSRPRPISYASLLDTSNNVPNNGSVSPSLHFYGGNDFGDEYMSGGVHHQVEDQLAFIDEPGVDPVMSPSGRSDSLVFPYGEDVNSIPSPHSHPFHRSCSVNDAAFLDEVGSGGNGFLWRPCMYFARGFCKNGNSCKFLHSDMAGVEPIDIGSPNKNGSPIDELMRMKALQHQRFALMASGSHHPFAYNKCMDSLNENLRSDLLGFGAASSSSRQIYLTFPADSTFKEEDVSSYFSMFGPVQDVRIPYQQKRMFGFVTFVYPETVKLILAKGNPHFVCDSRVLVKPYKEKGKVREKKQHQPLQLERGEYSSCLSPPGVDSGEHFDLLLGSRILLSPQEMMFRRKLEQEVELQHAIELQSRRMMNLQLMDLKNEDHNYHYPQRFPAGIPYPSPRQSQLLMNQHVAISSDSLNRVDPEEVNSRQEAAVVADEKLDLDGSESSSNNIDGGNQQHNANTDDFDPHESLEHILPDNLFASPTKSSAEHQSIFSQASDEADVTTPVTIASSDVTPILPSSSPLTIASLKSCYLQMPRFSSGQEAIEM